MAQMEELLLTILGDLGEIDSIAIYDEAVSRLGHDLSVVAMHLSLGDLEDRGLVASRYGETLIAARGNRPRKYFRRVYDQEPG